MSSINLAQHEQYLKSLESSLRKICHHHEKAVKTMKQSWDMSLHLFSMIENLRKNRFELEKKEQ